MNQRAGGDREGGKANVRPGKERTGNPETRKCPRTRWKPWRGASCLSGHKYNLEQCDWSEAIKYGRNLRNPDGTPNCAATVEDGSHCDTNGPVTPHSQTSSAQSTHLGRSPRSCRGVSVSVYFERVIRRVLGDMLPKLNREIRNGGVSPC